MLRNIIGITNVIILIIGSSDPKVASTLVRAQLGFDAPMYYDFRFPRDQHRP